MQQPKVKSKLFRTLLPTIQKLRSEGYTAEQITDTLNGHGLDLSVKTYKLYLHRYAKDMDSSNTDSLNVNKPSNNDDDKIVNDTVQENSGQYEVGTPEHKAKVQAETEELFKGFQKTGLRGK